MNKNTQAIITRIIALLAFLFMGARVVQASDSWECHCISTGINKPECEWCYDGTPEGFRKLTDHELQISQDNSEWLDFEVDAYWEYNDLFTALFNSYETKWSKNNRLMMKTPGNSFKFVKKGA